MLLAVIGQRIWIIDEEGFPNGNETWANARGRTQSMLGLLPDFTM